MRFSGPRLRLQAFGMLLADDCLRLLALPAAAGLPVLYVLGTAHGIGSAYVFSGLFILLLVLAVRFWAIGWFVAFSTERDLRSILGAFEDGG